MLFTVLIRRFVKEMLPFLRPMRGPPVGLYIVYGLREKMVHLFSKPIQLKKKKYIFSLYIYTFFFFLQVFIALGILICYIMGRSLEWNWLALAACLFLFPFVFGLYFIPESPPWLIYNDEEDLAYKSMLMIRGEEYDASIEICR